MPSIIERMNKLATEVNLDPHLHAIYLLGISGLLDFLTIEAQTRAEVLRAILNRENKNAD